MTQISRQARTQPSWYAKEHGVQSWKGLTRSVKAYHLSSQTTPSLSCPLGETNPKYCPKEISAAALTNHAAHARQPSSQGSQTARQQSNSEADTIHDSPDSSTNQRTANPTNSSSEPRIKKTPAIKQLKQQINQAKKGKTMEKKQPPRAIEIASESDD